MIQFQIFIKEIGNSYRIFQEQYYFGRTVSKSTNFQNANKYSIDFRVREVEEKAEQAYLEQQEREKIHEERRKRERQLQMELQYSSHNIQMLDTKQVHNESKSFNRSYYQNQDNLANETFNNDVNRMSGQYQNHNRGGRDYAIKSFENKIPIENDIVKNYKSNEVVLNYLDNDDYNFNERLAKSFVERKIDEEASTDHHDHNNPYSKASKHCGACQRKKQQDERKKKEITYHGVDLNGLLLQCKDALQKKNYQRSEQLLLQALQKEVDHADVYYLLGETYRLQNRLKEAEKYLLQALLFQFHSPFTFNSLGTVYMQLGQYERAVKLLKKFVEMEEEAKAFFNIGICLVKLGEYLDSVVYFGRAIELDETEGIFYLHRADAYELLGFVDMSLKDYRLYKRFSPNGIRSLQNQYSSLMKEGRLAEAKNLENYIKKVKFA